MNSENSMDREPSGLYSMGLQRVRQDWATNTCENGSDVWNLHSEICFYYLLSIITSLTS